MKTKKGIKIDGKIVYFFRLEIMNASAIMDDAAINNEYAGNSGIEGVGVGVGGIHTSVRSVTVVAGVSSLSIVQ